MLELLAGRPMPLARAVVLLLMVGGPTLAEGYPPSEDRLSAPGDLTFEFRVRDTSREGEVACGEGDGWKGGQVAFDRDFAVSFHEGRVAFGVETDTGSAWTICGEAVVLDGDWHHVAVQRRGSDGWLWIWVDGELDGAGYGPEGSLRSGKRSGPLEGEPFFGLVDDIRREDALLYREPFTPRSAWTESAWLPGLREGAVLEAYPNAELGQTILFARFPQPVNGAVQVTIRDGRGRVRAEVAGSVERGSAMLVWDGKATDGSACEPGPYVASMRGPAEELSASFEVTGI